MELPFPGHALPYTERQVASELLDQPAFAGIPQKLFICSTPRSGSNTLCRLLIEADLGIPHEYFNPVYLYPIAKRFGVEAEAFAGACSRNRLARFVRARLARTRRTASMAAYIDSLIRYRTRSGIFAGKIQYWQYQAFLDNPIGWRMLDGAAFVYLYRRDLLSQAVSSRFARLTGCWDLDNVPTTPPDPRPDFFDVARIEAEVRDLAEQDSQWRVFFARNGISPLVVTLEELCADPHEVVARIASVLGRAMPAIPQTASLQRYSEDDTSLPRKQDVAAHFIRVVRQLRPMQVQASR